MNIKQLINVLKDETLFGITKDGKDMLLYTQHFILSSKDLDVDRFIKKLELLDYIKDDGVYAWGMYGIRPSEYNMPTNAVELYHKYMDAPRSSAEYTLYAYTSSFGKVTGHVFAIENANNEVLAEKFFKLFNSFHYEFTHADNKAFVVDGKHIVTPLKVYRTRGFKVVKIEAV